MFAEIAAAAALLLTAAPTASAQAAASNTAYLGPRFPDGPDSLRALVHRATRLAGPGPAGRVALEFELAGSQQAKGLRIVPLPKATAGALISAAATAQDYLRTHMPNWQPGTPDPRAFAGQVPKVVLALGFTAAPAARPYAYADQQPVFAEITASEKVRAQPKPIYSAWDLIRQVQRQIRYPKAAMINNEMGAVYVYFEVAETGAIEQLQAVGTASPSLDGETLRVFRTVPAATSLARLRGQPVRVYYVLPITFKIQ